MAAWARLEQLELRFIEYMDVGCSNGWRPADVVSARQIRETIHRVWAIEPCDSREQHETAERFRYRDGRGQIGMIASITQPFCQACSRARVSSRGELFPCLFASEGLDLAMALRQGEDLCAKIAAFWHKRWDRYSELRAHSTVRTVRSEMSAIGG